jgi:maltooligosyltrehalose trehalohydrolase
LAVILDVVYNHLGPEGAYLAKYGPYFTEQYRTGWGTAVNLDGPYSDEVRNFFIQNALYWITEFHIDALRLDAVHALFDPLAPPFLEQLADLVHEQCEQMGRRVYLIAESDLNNPRLIQPKEMGGYGLDAQWNDEFHHVLEGLLIKEQSRYYPDFDKFDYIAKTFAEAYVYTGQYSPLRRRQHGRSPRLDQGHKFIVFLQNHDQVGNRPQAARLSSMISLDELKVAASLLLLSPFIPLLFMGEEYAEPAPFNYFVSFSDPDLIEAVRKGRAEEFSYFDWAEAADPQAEATFRASKLQHNLRHQGQHGIVHAFYRELLRLRRELPALAHLSLSDTSVTLWEEEKVVFIQRRASEQQAALVCSLGDRETILTLPLPAGRWRKQLDTAALRWLGSGPEAPETLDSNGEVRLSIQPKSCTLWVQV